MGFSGLSNTKSKKSNKLRLQLIGFWSLIVCMVLSFILFPYYTEDSATFTVSKTERVSDGESSTYLIFTEGEVFENSDSLMRWKWNSSDMYGEMKAGQTYKAVGYGWRIPFLSSYRNIVTLTKQ